MLLLTLTLLAGAQDVPAPPPRDVVSTAVLNYRERTRATVRCSQPDGSDEIVVCANRDADEYRVPFIPASSPRNSVPMRTEYLTTNHSALPCGQGPFLVRCGSVGVTATIGFDGSIQYVERPRAP